MSPSFFDEDEIDRLLKEGALPEIPEPRQEPRSEASQDPNIVSLGGVGQSGQSSSDEDNNAVLQRIESSLRSIESSLSSVS